MELGELGRIWEVGLVELGGIWRIAVGLVEFGPLPLRNLLGSESVICWADEAI